MDKLRQTVVVQAQNIAKLFKQNEQLKNEIKCVKEQYNSIIDLLLDTGECKTVVQKEDNMIEDFWG